ncbi:hypothetical protein FRC08_010300 [Ceratobasidium sp. 394]|nr:hypothetical protein FRC08_010300 [Ceratobasidium sp. 394]
MTRFADVNSSDNTPVPWQSALPQPVVFSRDPYNPNPHATVRALKNRPTFPPISVIHSLLVQLEDAWHGGYRSIQDTYYEKFPLPFWVLTVWSMLDVADNLRAGWMAVEDRIRSSKHRDPELHLLIRGVSDRLSSNLHQLAWNEPILGFPSLGWRPDLNPPTLENLAVEDSMLPCTPLFFQFFRDGFLNDDAMNMMLHFLDLQVQRHETLANRIVIADLAFTGHLLAEYSGGTMSTVAPGLLLPRIGCLFTELGRKILYFVINPGKDHWAAFKVDFCQRTIAYGDSWLDPELYIR